ncbi:energy-coupling factor transporter transmembrane protein EcfT [Paenibacillus sp. SI8]
MQGDTFLHRLDPRTKIIGCIALSAVILSRYDVVIAAVETGFLVAAYALARIQLRHIMKRLRVLWLLLLVSFLFQSVLTEGTMWLEIAGIEITHEGVIKGVITVDRLLVLMFSSFLLTMTTPPIRLASGLEKLMSPLARIGVPVHKFAMLVSLALRFVPVMNEEAELVARAQRSRGAPLRSRRIRVRIRSMAAVLIPMLSGSLLRAGDLAVAMEARCYSGGVHPTRTRSLRYGREDWISWGAISLVPLLAMLRSM